MTQKAYNLNSGERCFFFEEAPGRADLTPPGYMFKFIDLIHLMHLFNSQLSSLPNPIISTE